jgi:hypothetical protein
MTSMMDRTPGFYLVEWSDLADPELAARRPGPLVGEWDGRVWWFSRMQAYQFDCDVKVISELMAITSTVSPRVTLMSAAA